MLIIINFCMKSSDPSIIATSPSVRRHWNTHFDSKHLMTQKSLNDLVNTETWSSINSYIPILIQNLYIINY